MLKREWILVMVVLFLSVAVMHQIAFSTPLTSAAANNFLLGVGTQQNPNLASPGCKACRDHCVQAREHCRTQACVHSGGKDRNAGACDGGNQQAYANEAQGCYKNELACNDSCQKGACK